MPPAYVMVPAGPPAKGMAVAALVLGILAAIFGLIPILGLVSFPLGALALILGLIAARKNKRAQPRVGGVGTARAGWILGVVGIALASLGVAIVNKAVNDLDACFDGDQAACERLNDDEVDL
jgi:hypothetical protein